MCVGCGLIALVGTVGDRRVGRYTEKEGKKGKKREG